jgi:hypothetical protein
MNKLQPFLPLNENLTVEGDIQIIDGKIDLKFEWSDPKEQLELPDDLELERADELWKHTCFEAFLQPEGSNRYYEINISTSGAWNVYEFQDYRRPQPPIATEKANLLSFHLEENAFEAFFDFQDSSHVWRCSLTAVIELKDKKKHYFALEHFGDRPDFHLAESFKLRRVAHESGS